MDEDRDTDRDAGDLPRAARWLDASGVAAQDWPVGALYVVATPIGNAGDLSLRALWLLSMADAVFAEDTRVTRTLLERFGLHPPALLAAHEHNENEAAERIVARLAAGERVALVSDAGTPAVSDPGARIVRAVRAAAYRVIPIPGASSVLAAVAASGLADAGFSFAGFVPSTRQARETALQAAAASPLATVLFEAPHRIAATAAALAAALPADRPVAVARELTKKFESIELTHAAALPALVASEAPRGEYVLVIGAASDAAASSIDAGTRRLLAALADALPASKAAAVAARATGLPRDELYRALLAMRPGASDAPD